MKYLKKFENFDLGRFNEEGKEKQDFIEDVEDVEDDCEICDTDEDDDENDDTEETQRRRVWGDEVVEKKAMNPGFKAYLDKQKAKKEGKSDDKKADKKADKKEEKVYTKGLTTAQKKLPPALQKSILAKKKKK